MAKLMAPNIRIDWYPEGHFADPENPTLGELNSGYNLSPAIVTGYTLDFTDTDTVDVATIYDNQTSELFTHSSYEANLQFFLAPRGSSSANEGSYRMAEELFYHNQFAKGYLVKRFGYKWNVEFQPGQKIDIFYFQSTYPKLTVEDGNPILLDVLFLPLGFAVSSIPAGLTFAWLGEPHNSPSVKYVNGSKVAENLWPNPQFKTPLESDNPYGSVGIDVSRQGNTLQIEALQDLGTFTLLQFSIFDSRVTTPGNYLAIRLEGLNYLGFHGGVRWRVGTLTDGSWQYGNMTKPDDSDVITGTWHIPEGTAGGHVRLVLYFREWFDTPLTEGRVIHIDRVHFAVADTEQKALEQVETYFDGDGEIHG